MIGRLRLTYYKLKYGRNLNVGRNFHSRLGIMFEIVKPGIVTIGDNCFMNNYCSINCLNHIYIGDDCLFGEGVKIYDHNHRFYYKKLIREQGFSVKEIYIGNNVWIGSNVTILAGSKIGDNCIIGAGCIINGTIEANSIVKCDNAYSVSSIEFRDK